MQTFDQDISDQLQERELPLPLDGSHLMVSGELACQPFNCQRVNEEEDRPLEEEPSVCSSNSVIYMLRGI